MPGFFGGPVFLWVPARRPLQAKSRGEQVITLGFKPEARARPRPRRLHPQISLFLKMCEQVAEFMEKHDGQDFEVFFARDGNSIKLYLMSRVEAYDFDLSRKLAEFAAPYL